MSQLCLRLFATLLLFGQITVFCVLGGAAAVAEADAAPNTWQLLSTPTSGLGSPVLALAVDPQNPSLVLAGTQDGGLYRSLDAGAQWSRARGVGHAVTAITFDPATAGRVLAGTTGAGIWLSTDDGASWGPTTSTAGQSIRAITAGGGILAAGTQRGVLLSVDGSAWTSAGLGSVDVSALAIVTGGAQPTLVAGGDGELAGQPLPLYLTQNGGAGWTSVAASVPGSTMVSALLTLPATGGASTPTLLLGTNGGLYRSTDGGAQWSADNGGGALPPVDVTSLAVGSADGQTIYVASDGGASTSGGLWVSRDGGSTFASLQPPQPSVTGLAVLPGADPQLYATSFRPLDHEVMFWSYEDAGGTPRAPLQSVPPLRQGAVAAAPMGTTDWVRALSQGPEMPFLIVAACSILIILTALGAYARSARRL